MTVKTQPSAAARVTAVDKLADVLIEQHLAGHITVRGIVSEAFRQGLTSGEMQERKRTEASLRKLAWSEADIQAWQEWGW